MSAFYTIKNHIEIFNPSRNNENAFFFAITHQNSYYYYCASVYLSLPGYLLKRLQKIEFAAASFVYGRYVNDKAQLAPS